MRAVAFPEANVVYAKDQEGYIPLPAHVSPTPEGHVVTCWRLGFMERLRILFGGKLYVSLMTFHKPLTPIFMTTKKSKIFQDVKR